MNETRELHCTTCAAPTPFGQPPCPDEHDDACPEWLCLHCGEAILLDPPHPTPATRYVRTAA